MAAEVAGARGYRRLRSADRWHQRVDQLDGHVDNTDDFEQIGAAFEVAVGLSTGQVGDATARLTRQRPLVDFATDWMEAHRPKV